MEEASGKPIMAQCGGRELTRISKKKSFQKYQKCDG
jgi:hypothetical protein